VEGALKSALAEFRIAAPLWIPREAGGHTEWFSAVHFANAIAQLHSALKEYSGQLLDLSAFIRGELERSLLSFEPWACDQAQRIFDDAVSISLGYEPTVASHSLRDWLDAYRFFDLPLFRDDPEALEHVIKTSRLHAA